MTTLNLARLQTASAGLTTATTAYTANDTLGTIITMAMTAPGIIMSAQLVDKAQIVGAVDAYLFDRSVTLAADNAANAISDADMLFCAGIIQFPTPTTQTNNGIAVIDSLAIPCVANAGNNMFVALVTRTAHTFFGAVGDLVITFNYTKDV